MWCKEERNWSKWGIFSRCSCIPALNAFTKPGYSKCDKYSEFRPQEKLNCRLFAIKSLSFNFPLKVLSVTYTVATISGIFQCQFEFSDHLIMSAHHFHIFLQCVTDIITMLYDNIFVENKTKYSFSAKFLRRTVCFRSAARRLSTWENSLDSSWCSGLGNALGEFVRDVDHMMDFNYWF